MMELGNDHRITFAVLFTLTFVTYGLSESMESSCELGKTEGLVDVAVDLLLRIRKSITIGHIALHDAQSSTCPANCSVTLQQLLSLRPLDCAEVKAGGGKASGVYKIFPRHRILPQMNGFDVYCDMETDGGGWTVIQKRGDYGRPINYFFKDWHQYKVGFGDLRRDFWLGNDKIHALTSQKLYTLRFDMKDMDGNTREALYKEFWISDESLNYTLHANGFSGNAGDSFTDHSGMMFSTSDKDNDKSTRNCADRFQGAWWYNSCHLSNLNGLYLKGKYDKPSRGVEWNSWKGSQYSLFETEMKIRPLVT